MKIESAEQLSKFQKVCKAELESIPRKILVCLGPGCLANGSEKILDEFRKIISERNIEGVALESIKKTGCHGFCAQGPLVIMEPSGLFYTHVQIKDVAEIVEKSISGGEVISKLLYSAPDNGHKIEDYHEIPFYSRQKRISLRNVGKIDPEKIRDYIAAGRI